MPIDTSFSSLPAPCHPARRPRAYWPNFDFEYTLNNPHYQQSAKMKSICDVLSWRFLFASCPTDVFITQAQCTNAYRTYLASSPIELGQPMQNLEMPFLQNTSEFYPWGFPQDASNLPTPYGFHQSPTLQTLRKANSRGFSVEIETRHHAHNENSIFLFEIASSEQIENLKAALLTHTAVLLKTEFGTAGRDQFRLLNTAQLPQAHTWCQKMLKTNKVFVEKLMSLGRHWGIQAFRDPASETKISSIIRGTYSSTGSPTGHHGTFKPHTNAGLNHLTDLAQPCTEALSKINYWGPTGIDVFEFKPHIRTSPTQLPCAVLPIRCPVEINARLTMGWLAQEIANRFSHLKFDQWHWEHINFSKKVAVLKPQSHIELEKLEIKMLEAAKESQEGKNPYFITTPLILNGKCAPFYSKMTLS
jgi:hypothetical protein